MSDLISTDGTPRRIKRRAGKRRSDENAGSGLIDSGHVGKNGGRRRKSEIKREHLSTMDVNVADLKIEEEDSIKEAPEKKDFDELEPVEDEDHDTDDQFEDANNTQNDNTEDGKVGKEESQEDVNISDDNVADTSDKVNDTNEKPQSQEPLQVYSIEPVKRAATPIQEVKSFEPRLVIGKLVLVNFKSYAGQQIIGPFHSSFSAVVGPNGSGKSNVIDAMLFVFGFRASKMRQAKLGELIHNSESFPNLDFCSVDIHFHIVQDSEEEGEPAKILENSGLVVSRKAFKNNSSKYYINNRESNYSTVTTMLKEKGIDLDHKRFLILQGEVESIAQMKAKAEKDNDDGLLEYLEDIIGTTEYKNSIEKIGVQIEELNDVCVEKENRFEIVEREKTSLEEKKTQAVEFLENEKRFKQLTSLSLQFSLLDDRQSVESTSKKIVSLKDKLTQEQTETAEFKREIDVATNAHRELVAELKKLNNELSNLEAREKKIERERISVDEKIKQLGNKTSKSQSVIASYTRNISENEHNLKAIADEQSQHESRMQQLQQELRQEKTVLDKMKSELSEKTQGISQQIESYKKKLQPWADKLNDKESQISLAKSEVEMLQNQWTQIDASIKECEAQEESIGASQNEKSELLKSLKAEKAHITEQIGYGVDEVKNAREKLAQMKRELGDFRQRCHDARGSLQSVQNRGKVLSGLMRLKESGRIEGFYGRLGDLGSIDDKYDVAISTAAPSLDDIVVETVEVGQHCIEYLRKNNLGFGRFIILNKLRKFNLGPIESPNGCARLFDLIRAKEEKFRPAFYSVMYDTLVTRTLKEANQVAYGKKRWRVVTLDGNLIDTSGTLSGGGGSQRRGAMKKSSQGNFSPDEVAKLEKELNLKESAFEEAQATFVEMETGLRKFQDRVPEIELEMSKIKLELDSLTKQLESLSQRRAEMAESKRALTARSSELKTAEKKVATLISEKAALKEQTKDLDDKISQLEEEIMKIGGVALRKQDSKVSSITQQMELSNERNSSNSVRSNKLQSEIKRFEKVIEEQNRETEVCQKRLAEIQEKHKETENTLQQLSKQIKEIETVRDEKLCQSEECEEELEKKRQKVNSLRSAEIEILNKIEKHESAIRSAKRNVEEAEKQYRSIDVRDVACLIAWGEESDELRGKLMQNEVTREITLEELSQTDIEKVQMELGELEAYISSAKVDTDVLLEYSKRYIEYSSRKTDLNQSVEKRDGLKNESDELKKKRHDEFMAGFHKISMTLKEMYQLITMGGNAELELVDSLDPFSEGILFSVMPPKKSWRNISNLSGGEKTLSSLALVFALHRYKPTPLYVMDEIDAALDFRNVSIVANYIKERTKNAQFIVISLRNNMFELAKQLVGIYKVNSMTKSISLQNNDLLNGSA